MEVKIGIQNVAREVVIEATGSEADIEAAVRSALDGGPLVRATVARVGGAHVVRLLAHHAVLDGYAVTRVFRRIVARLRAEGAAPVEGGDTEDGAAEAANLLVAEMRKMASLESVTSSANLQRPEIQIAPKTELAAQLGVSASAMAQTVATPTSDGTTAPAEILGTDPLTDTADTVTPFPCARYIKEIGRGPNGARALTAEDTIASAVAAHRLACSDSRAAIVGLDLDDVLTGNRRGPLPLRWVLVHVLRELAQHAGHADILREQILAAREG